MGISLNVTRHFFTLTHICSIYGWTLRLCRQDVQKKIVCALVSIMMTLVHFGRVLLHMFLIFLAYRGRCLNTGYFERIHLTMSAPPHNYY